MIWEYVINVLFVLKLMIGILYFSRMLNINWGSFVFGSIEFQINKIEIWTEEGTYDVIPSRTYKNIRNINKEYIRDWYEKIFCKKINEEDKNKNDIRLKMFYTFKRERYICYFPYVTDNVDGWNIPLINDDDMIKYRKDIIEPFYGENEKIRKYYLYSLFMMDSRDLSEIWYNGEVLRNIDLRIYMKKIAGPKHDYGILTDMPIKMKWIYEENWEVFRDNFREIKMKFMAMYMDEIEMELKEHVYESEDLEDYFITEYMEQKLIEKNKEYGRDFKFKKVKENKNLN